MTYSVWWCVFSGHYLLVSDLWFAVRLLGRVYQTFWPWLTGLVMGDVYSEGPLKKYVDYCMRSSNEDDFAKPIGRSSLGVVDLDTSIVPDVFGLRAFDSREPISRMLPGQFSNQLRVLVLDAAETPVDFHDIILDDLCATPALRARRITPGDVTSPATLADGFVCHHVQAAG